MTNLQLATYIRWKANVDANTPYDDASLLPIVNANKDEVASAIVRKNENYFGDIADTETIADVQDYRKPSDLLLLKRAEVSYTDSPYSHQPATLVTLEDFDVNGEDYYAAYNDYAHPLVRFDGTQFYVYPEPTSSTAGAARLSIWYVAKRDDLADLSSSTSIEDTTDIGSDFHPLIAQLTVNDIKEKQGLLTPFDVQKMKLELLETMVPAATRVTSNLHSDLPSDLHLMY